MRGHAVCSAVLSARLGKHVCRGGIPDHQIAAQLRKLLRCGKGENEHLLRNECIVTIFSDRQDTFATRDEFSDETCHICHVFDRCVIDNCHFHSMGFCDLFQTISWLAKRRCALRSHEEICLAWGDCWTMWPLIECRCASHMQPPVELLNHLAHSFGRHR